MLDDIDRDLCAGVARRIIKEFSERPEEIPEGAWGDLRVKKIKYGDPGDTIVLGNESGHRVTVMIQWGDR